MSEVGLFLLAVLLAFALPGLLCWTAAVMSARVLRGLRTDPSVVGDVLLAGSRLVLIGLASAVPAVAVAAAGLLASAFQPGGAGWGGRSFGSTVAVAGLVLALVGWVCFRPAVCDEWDRLAR